MINIWARIWWITWDKKNISIFNQQICQVPNNRIPNLLTVSVFILIPNQWVWISLKYCETGDKCMLTYFFRLHFWSLETCPEVLFQKWGLPSGICVPCWQVMTESWCSRESTCPHLHCRYFLDMFFFCCTRNTSVAYDHNKRVTNFNNS